MPYGHARRKRVKGIGFLKLFWSSQHKGDFILLKKDGNIKKILSIGRFVICFAMLFSVKVIFYFILHQMVYFELGIF